jgi:hypothetical protein
MSKIKIISVAVLLTLAGTLVVMYFRNESLTINKFLSNFFSLLLLPLIITLLISVVYKLFYSEFNKPQFFYTYLISWAIVIISDIIVSNENKLIDKSEDLKMSKTEEKKTNLINGWSEERILKLKTKCFESFNEGLMPKNLINKEEFCDCVVDKTIKTISWNDFLNANESTQKMHQSISKNCKESVRTYSL